MILTFSNKVSKDEYEDVWNEDNSKEWARSDRKSWVKSSIYSLPSTSTQFWIEG